VIEPHAIRQLQRAHGVLQREAHRLVDVARAGDALLQRADALVDEGNEETLHEKGWHVDGLNGREPRALAESERELVSLVARDVSAHHLHDARGRGRLWKVEPEEPLRPRRGAGKLRDGERRRGGGQDGPRWSEPVHVPQQGHLGLEVLRNRLQDEIGIAGGLEARHRSDAPKHLLHFAGRQAVVAGAGGQALSHVEERALENLFLDVVQKHPHSAECGRHRDAAADESRPDDSDGLNVHRPSSFRPRPRRLLVDPIGGIGSSNPSKPVKC